MILVDTATDALEKGDAATALPLLREALDFAPSLTEAHFQLALALKQSQEANIL